MRRVFVCTVFVAFVFFASGLLTSAESSVLVESETQVQTDENFGLFLYRFCQNFSGERKQLGGKEQEYVLVVVQEQQNIAVHLDGKIEPLWEISIAQLAHHKRAIIFPPVIWADEAAQAAHKYLLKLEKARLKEKSGY